VTPLRRHVRLAKMRAHRCASAVHCQSNDCVLVATSSGVTSKPAVAIACASCSCMLQAVEAVKLAAGVGTVMARRLLVADALAGRFSTVQLRPRWHLQAADGSVSIDFSNENVKSSPV
jgi:hypothetical protein